MRENVGDTERTVRAVLGPSLVVLGYTQLGGHEGRTLGLAAMILGALVIESAITRVCPTKATLGLD